MQKPDNDRDERDNPEFWRTDSEGYKLHLAERKAGEHRRKRKLLRGLMFALLLAATTLVAFVLLNRR